MKGPRGSTKACSPAAGGLLVAGALLGLVALVVLGRDDVVVVRDLVPEVVALVADVLGFSSFGRLLPILLTIVGRAAVAALLHVLVVKIFRHS
jgi:hypothetical protein